MPRKRWIVLATCVVGAVAASAVLASTDSTDLKGPGVIRITNSEVARGSHDAAPPGRSTGDLLVLNQMLYNRRITRAAIGHEELICTFMGSGAAFGSGSRNCVATFLLPRGKIVAQGAVHNLYFYALPVVGGTGIYSNVRGTLTVTFLGSGPRRELLFFRLTV